MLKKFTLFSLFLSLYSAIENAKPLNKIDLKQLISIHNNYFSLNNLQQSQ